MPGVRKTKNVNVKCDIDLRQNDKTTAPLAGTVILLTFFHFNYITDGCVLLEHTFLLISLWHRFVCRCALSLWHQHDDLLFIEIKRLPGSHKQSVTHAAEINEEFMLNVSRFFFRQRSEVGPCVATWLAGNDQAHMETGDFMWATLRSSEVKYAHMKSAAINIRLGAVFSVIYFVSTHRVMKELTTNPGILFSA